MKYKHIVFDVDGTLLDTEHVVLSSFQQALKQSINLHKDVEDLKFILGITGNDALEQMGVNNKEEVLACWASIVKDYKNNIDIFDGMKSTLQGLVDKGYVLGIATTRKKEHTIDDLIKFGIDKYFGTVICKEDSETHKPTPGPLLKYMELSGTKPQEILFIGDNENDRSCANLADIDFALAVWGANDTEVKAKYHVTNPVDLLEVL